VGHAKKQAKHELRKVESSTKVTIVYYLFHQSSPVVESQFTECEDKIEVENYSFIIYKESV
jgi:hypothetical protein